MSSLMKKMLKNSTIKETSILSESIYFTEEEMIKTSIPALNIALSGDVDGGLSNGVVGISGPSRHYKTGYGLALAKAYLDHYEDSVLLFYDSEFGSPQSYFNQFGISTDRVIHTPFVNLEMLRTDLMNQLNGITRGEKVFILIDSIGNAASSKEIHDAVEGKEAADFTRAKVIKSMFRMSTPVINMLNIPLVFINHVYQTMEMYSKTIMSGGQGAMLAADTVLIVGKSQEKDSDGTLSGFNFTLNVEKSRFVIEKSKIPVSVSFDGGINKYSGILEMAIEAGEVIKPSNGWYSLVDTDSGVVSDKKVRAKDTETEEFLGAVLQRDSFKKWVKRRYQLSTTKPKQVIEESDDD